MSTSSSTDSTIAAVKPDNFPKTQPKLNENENTMATSSSSEQPGTPPSQRDTQKTMATASPTGSERPKSSTSLKEVHNTIAGSTPQEQPITPPTLDEVHAIKITFNSSPPSTPTLSASSSSPSIKPLRPIHAEHYPPTLPFALSPHPVTTASPTWTLAMRLCGYGPSSIASVHYFTKSITYHPSWCTRILRKNEHRLVPASHKIETRELWALQLYYSGPKRAAWDEVVPADWNGGELDAVVEMQEMWIHGILRIIAQAQTKEVRAEKGSEVRLVSYTQMQHPTEGGNGGAFANWMLALAQAVQGLEEVLRRADAGGPRNWEAERDGRDLIAKYAHARIG